MQTSKLTLAIPKQAEELAFGPCESSRGSTIVSSPILEIWGNLQSSIPGALAQPKYQFFSLFGYTMHTEEAAAGFVFLTALQISMAIVALFSMGWIVLCLKLRQINKVMYFTQVLAVPDYQLAIQEIQGAVTSEELRGVYGENIRKYPQIACILKNQYKDRLDSFKDFMR